MLRGKSIIYTYDVLVHLYSYTVATLALGKDFRVTAEHLIKTGAWGTAERQKHSANNSSASTALLRSGADSGSCSEPSGKHGLECPCLPALFLPARGRWVLLAVFSSGHCAEPGGLSGLISLTCTEA